MNYVQFHIGDWMSGTRYLSPLEKGVYIDLIALYYEREAPIIRTYYERIRNAYTDDERKAFDFVISEFFTETEDGFHNARCDEEIAKVRAKSESARKSVAARWKKNQAKTTDKPSDANENASNTGEIRTYNERSTNEILTNNHKPITNRDVPNLGSGSEPPPLFPEGAPEEKPEQKAQKDRLPVPDTLPLEWRREAELARPDIDVDHAWRYYRTRYAPTSSKRTIGGWHKAWLAAVAQEYPDRKKQFNQGYKNPAFQTTTSTLNINPETGDF